MTYRVILKNINDNGMIVFTPKEIKFIVHALNYKTKKRRIQYKIFKQSINKALRKLLKGLKND